MFENIYFNRVTYSNSTNTQAEAYDLSGQEAFMSISMQYHFWDHCSYCLDGENESILLRPLKTPNPHFAIIQMFTHMYATRNFFTSRSGTQSYMILYTYKGAGELVYRDKSIRLEKGTGVFIDCGELNKYRALTALWEYSALHIYGGNTGELYREFSRIQGIVFKSAASYQRNLEDLLRTYQTVIPCWEIRISNSIENMLIRILTSSSGYQRELKALPDSLSPLIQYLSSNLSADLSLDHLAEYSGISKYHLCRLFQKYIGKSPKEYITGLRIERAVELLLTTDMPANKIGYEVGIHDEYYFYRLFKKYTHMTPSEFRK